MAKGCLTDEASLSGNGCKRNGLMVGLAESQMPPRGWREVRSCRTPFDVGVTISVN